MSEPIGRRGLPADDEPAVTPAAGSSARRGSPPEPDDIAHVTPGTARRAAVEADGEEPRRAWLLLGALAVVLVAAIVAAFLLFGSRPTATPGPGTATGSATPPASASPAVSASPSATGTSSPAASPSPDSPSTPVELNDATLTLPSGWELYADETVQDSRRLVRLRELASDTRLQAVTLTTVSDSLGQACSDLVADHQTTYTGVTESLSASVPVLPVGEAVTCSFAGTRVSDSVPADVTFTVVRRDSDAHALVLRATVPDAAAGSTLVAAQLESIQCGAADSFGVPLTRCSATPGQADG